MELAGHKCVGHCEIDKYANRSYVAMHRPKEEEWFEEDITKVKSEDIPYADAWCFGFPCQDISIAGKQRGLEGARSKLFYETIEHIKSKKEEDKPAILFYENVKNLLSVNGGWDFTRVLCSMDEAGYDAEWQVLNSKDFGVPQNRERVFIIGHLRTRRTRKVFPVRSVNEAFDIEIIGTTKKSSTKIGQRERVYSSEGIMGCLHATDYKQPKQILVGYLGVNSQGNRVYDSKGLGSTLCGSGGGLGGKTGLYYLGNINPSGRGQNGKIYDIKGMIPALTTNKGQGPKVLVRAVLTPNRINKRQNGRRFKNEGEPMFTLTAQDIHGVLISEATQKGYSKATEGDSINLAAPGSKTRRGRVGKQIANTLDTSCNQGTLINGRVRRLTPLECFRLQGWPDEYFYRAREVNSDTQLYKQAGNGVTVNVIYAIAKNFILD